MKRMDRWQTQLDQLRAEGRYRTLTTAAGIDFSSNDYLGYSKLAGSVCDRSRSGTASRLLRGHDAVWEEVEAKLAAWHGAEAALVMTSGYVANEGLLSAVVEPGDLVFSDQCNHASIIDGLRLCRAEKIVFSHNDVNDLVKTLRQRHGNRRAAQAWFIVTESLFGMEGDKAPLPELVDLAARFDANVIVDEAHATGCFGGAGSGLIDAAGLRARVLATMHTGGKALAVPGAYIVGSRQLKELLVNRCRHLIFTTALPPQIGAWWLDTLDRVATDEAARSALHQRAEFFRKECCLRGMSLGGSHYVGTIVLGSDHAALSAAARLQSAGFDIRAIRPPTVPVGTARLRISIHADHDLTVLRELAAILSKAN